MNWKKIALPAGIIAAGFILMFFLISLRGESPKKQLELRTKIVDAVVVQPADVQPVITAYGKVTSAQPVQLISEVSGELQQGTVPFQPAQSFRKGDLLLTIDKRQAELTLNSQKSDFLNALASVLPDIKVDFPDKYKIWDDYFSSASFDKPLAKLPAVNDKKLKLYLSRSNVFKLYFSIKNSEIILDKHDFYAPFNGTIISANLRIGSTARSGTNLGEIINLDALEVEVPLPAEDAAFIDRTKPITLYSSELDRSWQGFISRVGETIDQRTQSIPAYISMKDADNLPNGVFLSSAIAGSKIENAVLVPRQALYSERYVYLIKNNKLYYQEIDIVRKQEESVIVNSGLAAGDTLVIELMQGVAPGMPAEPRFLSMKEGIEN